MGVDDLVSGVGGNHESDPSTRRRPLPRSQVMSSCHQRKWRHYEEGQGNRGSRHPKGEWGGKYSGGKRHQRAFCRRERALMQRKRGGDEHDGAQGRWNWRDSSSCRRRKLACRAGCGWDAVDLDLTNALTFHRFLGRRTARCSLARGVVGGNSRARCGREGREEALAQVSVANGRSRRDVHSAREEVSDEQSDLVEDHATEARALAAMSTRVAVIKRRRGNWISS